MKILQVNKLYYPWIGGVEKVVQHISEGLNGKDGISCSVLSCQPKGKRVVEEINGVQVLKASSFGMLMRMPISLDFFILFKKLAKESDVIFLHYPYPLGFLASLLFGKNKRIVLWYHSDIVKQKFFNILLTPIHKAVLRKCSVIFVAGENIAKNSKLLSEFRDKIEVVPFGFDINITEDKEKLEKIKNKFKKPLVLSVGRLVYYKGFDYLIQAMKKVDANLLIIGDGPLKPKFIDLINKEKLNEKVFLLDFVEDLSLYYQACDLFVLSSVENSEAFGIVQIEALAHGKPVVNTNLPTAVPEVSIDGETGFTVEPKNVEALTIAINKILLDNKTKEKFSFNARERARSKFGKDLFLERIKEKLL